MKMWFIIIALFSIDEATHGNTNFDTSLQVGSYEYIENPVNGASETTFNGTISTMTAKGAEIYENPDLYHEIGPASPGESKELLHIYEDDSFLKKLSASETQSMGFHQLSSAADAPVYEYPTLPNHNGVSLFKLIAFLPDKELNNSYYAHKCHMQSRDAFDKVGVYVPTIVS